VDHTAGAACDPGRVRPNNEDAILVERLDAGWLLVAIADGMGGLSRGEVASKTCLDTLHSELRGVALTPQSAAEQLSRAALAAHDAVRRASSGDKIGTTLVAALTCGANATLANVGDSRAYAIKDGRICQLTEDHSVAAERVRAGLMTPAEAAASSYRHILLRSIGTSKQPPELDFSTVDLNDAILLLCSDGLYSMVTDLEMLDACAAKPPQAAADDLVRLANKRGGSDNISVVVVSPYGND
jgi:serine/threonine protein phosphatase PrpC